MTESTNELPNSRKLPIFEIQFSTSSDDNNVDDETPSDQLPILTVVYDGQRYSIVEGNELIERAMQASFRNLENDFFTVVTVSVDLRRVQATSDC